MLMPISINCCCGKSFTLEENLAGQQAKCQCGNSFVVPDNPTMPWKEYYRNGMGNLLESFKGLNLPFLFIEEQLTAYLGFLIAKEGTEIGIEQFSEIQPSYYQFKDLIAQYQQEQHPKEKQKILVELYAPSLAIGNYCKENYSFKRFSEIAVVENQLSALKFSSYFKEKIHFILGYASKKINILFRYKSLVIYSIIALLAVLGTALFFLRYQCIF